MAENQRGPGRPRKNQKRNQGEDAGGSQGVNENENPWTPILLQQQQQFMMQMMQQSQQFMQQKQQFMQQFVQGVYHSPPQEIGNRVFRQFYKMNPPFFEGGFDPLEAHGWLKEMEKVFKEGALAYMTAAHIPVDWEHFQEEFLKNYFPYSFRFQKEQEFFQFKQGTMSVSEFVAKFEEMAQFSPHSEYAPYERWIINRFKFGLRSDIGHIVALQSHNSYAELVQQCYIAEASLNKIHNEREQAWLNLEVDPLPTPMVVTAATDGSIEYGCHIRYGLAFFQFGISWMQRENGFHTTRKHGRRRSDICITR
ncbi:hypothetical protein QL285_020708 [Trifolium repens]|nr:hypothetical protein QL285_020708 [Trifolium repens]